MTYGRCYCPNACPLHERQIDAAEDARDYPIFDPRAADEECSRWEMSTRLGDR